MCFFWSALISNFFLCFLFSMWHCLPLPSHLLLLSVFCSCSLREELTCLNYCTCISAQKWGGISLLYCRINYDQSIFGMMEKDRKQWNHNLKTLFCRALPFNLACVASVSSRGSSRKLGQEQKKMNDGGGGGEWRKITRLETLATQATFNLEGESVN